MSHKKLLYNEEEISEKIYYNGFTGGVYTRREAGLLAKYMRHVLGYKDRKIKTGLIEFSKSDPNFNYVLESSVIKDIVKNSKSQFVIREKVSITKNEILKSKTIHDFKGQKLYLGMIALAKKNGSSWVSVKDWSVLKKVSWLSITTDEMYDLLHQLYKLKLIFPMQTQRIGRHKILYIDWLGEPEISIKNDDELYRLGRTYEDYCGGELGYCIVCEKEYVKTGNKNIYCSEHTSEKKLDRYKKYNQKRQPQIEQDS